MAANGRTASPAVKKELRQLPSVDSLLQMPVGQSLEDGFGHDLTVVALRRAIDDVRTAILRGDSPASDPLSILGLAEDWLAAQIAPPVEPVINATGVIIHTNLGRAPLSAWAVAEMNRAAIDYSALEYDLATGKRGRRAARLESQLSRVTGAEAALAVNNNAAAVLLMLTALCYGREVIISRGQLVEIGGGFRVPDVMAQSGARLVEVGTTNRTHLRDYEAAIGEDTAAILVAHHSNFKVVGFTSEPSLAELATLAHRHDLPLLYDQGSGALYDTTPYGLDAEPTVTEGLSAGAAIVAFSGDKLFGGPQAGILVGQTRYLDPIRRHPLARAVRADKIALAGLAATAAAHLTGMATTILPVWQMIARPAEDIAQTAASWAAKLRAEGVPVETMPGESTVGGGSLPGATLPTTLLALAVDAPDALVARLRQNGRIIARIEANRIVFDPRTVLPERENRFLDLVASICHPRATEKNDE